MVVLKPEGQILDYHKKILKFVALNVGCKETAQPVSSESRRQPPGTVRLMKMLRLRSAMSSKGSTPCAVKGT